MSLGNSKMRYETFTDLREAEGFANGIMYVEDETLLPYKLYVATKSTSGYSQSVFILEIIDETLEEDTDDINQLEVYKKSNWVISEMRKYYIL